LARKILLADDSVTAQNMGRKILTDAGYDVITVNNGSAALKRVAEQKPDLIVLDVYMPGYSGLEVCVRLKDAPETSRIPILLTVGKLEPFKPEEASRVRADGFIIKPFEASELLSALTRLEDRMVPSQADGGRFTSSVSGMERFSGGDPTVKKSGEDDADSGWKNRLRFPSKKKKEEPEPEPEPDFVTPSSFRDFRRGGGKAPAGTAPFPLSTAPAATQAPAIVPDIPRDITPEELDALSELAAKLDGAPAAQNVAADSHETTASESAATQASAVAETVPEATTDINASSASGEIRTEVEAVSGSAETEQAEVPVTSFAISSPDAADVSADLAPTVPGVAEEIAYKTETAIAQDAAPIDRDDEPSFASAVSAEAQAQSEQSEIQTDAATADDKTTAAASAEESLVAEHSAVVSGIEAVAPTETAAVEQVTQSADTAAVAAASATGAVTSEASSPSAEELAEALRFLTPAQPAGSQSLAEAGAALAKELSQGPLGRWVAESMPLSAEEAAGSLEAEMFRTFATPKSEETPSSSVSTETPANAVSEAATEVHSVAENAPAANSAEQSRHNSELSTTFTDAVSHEESATVAATNETLGTAAAETDSHQHSSSSENGPGGEETMGKEKVKGAKSNGQQTHSDAPVEAGEQSDETPKTMAASASAEGGSEASHIANIVDSVLADLRPKIVEEIAKQLAKK
jgi:CheY-like chemotaxis protein